MSATTPPIHHLTLITGGELTDADGQRVGRIEDLVVRLGEGEYPPISGAVAKVAGRLVFVPAEQIGAIEHGRITLAKARLDLQPFERREGELLLREDLLDRQLINVEGARLVRANEIEIARVEGWWRVVPRAGVAAGEAGSCFRAWRFWPQQLMLGTPRVLAALYGTE